MAYTPTEWETGDIITAEKLNNMEGGIEGAEPFVITALSIPGSPVSVDKTAAEIAEAVTSGMVVYLKLDRGPNAGRDYSPVPLNTVVSDDDPVSLESAWAFCTTESVTDPSSINGLLVRYHYDSDASDYIWDAVSVVQTFTIPD